MRTQIYFWVGAFLLLALFMWVFQSVLTPFILGIAVAYLLNPIVLWFNKIGIKRWLASLIILILFIIAVALIVIFAVPPIYRELSDLAQKVPGYLDTAIAFVLPYIEQLQAQLGFTGVDQFKSVLQDNAGKIFTTGTGLLAGIASGGQAAVSMLTTLILTPLVAFFMMKEWPAATKYVESLYPRKYASTIKDLLKKIDLKIAGFIRGQLVVAFFLGLIYAIALSIADLNYGFLIGITAGIASIVPLVGSTLGLVVSVGVAWLQSSGDFTYVGIIAAIFIVGQLLEGNVISPKIIGDSVGLHPLWIIFALMAGGSLYGIAGMLIAVPVTAAAGVLITYAIHQYKASKLYDA